MARTNLGGGLSLGNARNIGADWVIGIPVNPSHVYSIVPAALSATNVALAQAVAGAGNLALTAGAGVTAGTDFRGIAIYRLDVPRNVRITSVGNDSGITFTVVGVDAYNVPVTETITGANAGVASGAKALKAVYRVTASGAAAGNVSVGTGDRFGLPIRLNAAHFFSARWDAGSVNDLGTLTLAATAVATATTGDVRGTYQPSTASDGTRRLVVFITPEDVQFSETATLPDVYGVTQFPGAY